MVDDGAELLLESTVERGGASTIAKINAEVDDREFALVAAVPDGTTAGELATVVHELEAVLQREPNVNLDSPAERAVATDGGGGDSAP